MTKTNVKREYYKNSIRKKLNSEFRKTINRHKRVKRTVISYCNGEINGDDLFNDMVMEYGSGVFVSFWVAFIILGLLGIHSAFAFVFFAIHCIYVVSVYVHAFFEYLGR